MGCAESTPEANKSGTTEVDSGEKHLVQKTKNVQNLPAVESVEVKNENVSNGEKSNGGANINSHDSFEMIVAKKDKRSTSIKTNTRKGSQRSKPRELSRVQPAWGKRSTTIENNFLEDLRLLRNTAEKNRNYEKNYDTVEEDISSRPILGNENEGFAAATESSNSDLFKTSPVAGLPQSGEKEEYFDASKIIDVEKFRAANTTAKQTKEDDEDDKIKDRLHIQTKSSHENHKLHSSLQDVTIKKDESSISLYNEDDKDLIESIEQEFAHENYYLPGQIIN